MATPPTSKAPDPEGFLRSQLFSQAQGLQNRVKGILRARSGCDLAFGVKRTEKTEKTTDKLSEAGLTSGLLIARLLRDPEGHEALFVSGSESCSTYFACYGDGLTVKQLLKANVDVRKILTDSRYLVLINEELTPALAGCNETNVRLDRDVLPTPASQDIFGYSHVIAPPDSVAWDHPDSAKRQSGEFKRHPMSQWNAITKFQKRAMTADILARRCLFLHAMYSNLPEDDSTLYKDLAVKISQIWPAGTSYSLPDVVETPDQTPPPRIAEEIRQAVRKRFSEVSAAAVVEQTAVVAGPNGPMLAVTDENGDFEYIPKHSAMKKDAPKPSKEAAKHDRWEQIRRSKLEKSRSLIAGARCPGFEEADWPEDRSGLEEAIDKQLNESGELEIDLSLFKLAEDETTGQSKDVVVQSDDNDNIDEEGLPRSEIDAEALKKASEDQMDIPSPDEEDSNELLDYSVAGGNEEAMDQSESPQDDPNPSASDPHRDDLNDNSKAGFHPNLPAQVGLPVDQPLQQIINEIDNLQSCGGDGQGTHVQAVSDDTSNGDVEMGDEQRENEANAQASAKIVSDSTQHETSPPLIQIAKSNENGSVSKPPAKSTDLRSKIKAKGPSDDVFKLPKDLRDVPTLAKHVCSLPEDPHRQPLLAKVYSILQETRRLAEATRIKFSDDPEFVKVATDATDEAMEVLGSYYGAVQDRIAIQAAEKRLEIVPVTDEDYSRREWAQSVIAKGRRKFRKERVDQRRREKELKRKRREGEESPSKSSSRRRSRSRSRDRQRSSRDRRSSPPSGSAKPVTVERKSELSNPVKTSEASYRWPPKRPKTSSRSSSASKPPPKPTEPDDPERAALKQARKDRRREKRRAAAKAKAEAKAEAVKG